MKPHLARDYRTSDFGLRTLRRQHWVKWIQILTVALWCLFPSFYSPMPAAWEPDPTAAPPWTGTPNWAGVAPQPPDGPDGGDSDDDGLPNWFEVWLGTSPGNPDSDYDGISDRDELFHTGTNPKHWDSDGDGFSDHDASNDCWAVNHNDVGFGTAVFDWDGDGLYNHEDSFPFDPFNGNGSGVIDSDGDGVDDNSDSHPWDFTLWSDWNFNLINDHDEDPSSSPGDGEGGGNGDGNGNGDGSTPIDSDGDGVPDDSDSHPWNASLWCDHNQNGFNDHQEPPDPYSTDSDNDATVDAYDSHPWDSFLWNDHNHNGVNDHEETIEVPDPATLDSDSDRLPDYQEILLGTDPYMADTDGDGLSDFEEIDLETGYGTNPLNPDTDGDGLTDAEELMVQPTSSPLDAHSLSRAAGYGTLYIDWQMTDTTDSDGDGIPDRIEEFYSLWLDPNNPQDAGWDADGDQVTNLQAYLNGWIICATVKPLDRDGDGITDVQ